MTSHNVPVESALDLHAFQPRDVASVAEEYVHAAADAGLVEVRLIHGRGRGVQRGLVQAVLDRHPRVESFWDAPESHLGATVARLRAGEYAPEEQEAPAAPFRGDARPSRDPQA